MRRGLHVLGATKVVPDDAPSTSPPSVDQYAPYAQAAGQVISSIIQSTKQPAPSSPPSPPPPKEESNTAWYAAGAAALVVIGALLWRSRG